MNAQHKPPQISNAIAQATVWLTVHGLPRIAGREVLVYILGNSRRQDSWDIEQRVIHVLSFRFLSSSYRCRDLSSLPSSLL